MDRFYLPPSQWTASPVLTDEEAHHCTRVMRKSVGDEIEIFDGQGKSELASIQALDRKQVMLELLDDPKVTPKRIPQLELAVGIPKGKTMDLIIQKAVELGVNRITPLMTEQGNVQLGAKDGAKKAEKWRRVALEACKQCGQDWLPVVDVPCELESWLAQRESAELEIVGELTSRAKPLKNLLNETEKPRSLRFLVGPEGDFSPSEYHSIESASFQAADLGDLVLRVETAALLFLSVAAYEYGS